MNISSSSGSSSSSTDYSRITGLASGLDIDGLVESALSNYQSKIDKENQGKQTLEWQQEAYVDIINELKSFYDYFDIAKSNNILSSSNYVSTRSDVTGTGVAVSTLAGAVTGEYSVNVVSVAKAPTAQIRTSEGTKKSSTLAEAGLGSVNFELEIDGKTFSVDAEENITIEELISKIKNTKSKDGSTSLSSLVDVNFTELTGKLAIAGKTTGKNQELNISNKLDSDFEERIQLTAGQDAIVKIKTPGEEEAVLYTNSSNSFTIDNITYKVTKENSEVSFNVVKDSEESYKKFKAFIDSYNSIVEKINGKITEKKEYDYDPLTDSQKEEMTEDEIKKWETKSKQGILRRDNTLSSILTNMRSCLYEAVEGAGISLTDIGISTTSNYNDGGKLQIDKEKFKTAIENNSEAVQKLFTDSGDTNSKKGIFTKFKSIINDAVGYDGTLIKKAGYENTRWVSENTLSKKITDKNEVIKNLLAKLEEKREALYKKYSTLETNLNNLNSQSSYLTSQFSS